jgi:CheY-like chemotaxis protein
MVIIMQSDLVSESRTDRNYGSSLDIKAGFGLRALVVDDDAMTRRLHGRLLNIFKIRNVTASDGLEAVAGVMRAVDEGDPFDLIVMDLEMPVVDGWAAAVTLRAQGFKGAMIAISGCTNPGVRQRCIACGFDAYLSKPTTISELLATINQFSGLTNNRPNNDAFAAAV